VQGVVVAEPFRDGDGRDDVAAVSGDGDAGRRLIRRVENPPLPAFDQTVPGARVVGILTTAAEGEREEAEAEQSGRGGCVGCSASVSCL
jgi:hypothetical protein